MKKAKDCSKKGEVFSCKGSCNRYMNVPFVSAEKFRAFQKEMNPIRCEFENTYNHKTKSIEERIWSAGYEESPIEEPKTDVNRKKRSVNQQRLEEENRKLKKKLGN